MEATRQLFWNIGGKNFMYIAAIFALLVFFLGLVNKIRGWAEGRCGTRQGHMFSRVKYLILNVFEHEKNIFKSKYRRFMHLTIFYGFLILFIGTIIIAIQDHFGIQLFYGPFYLILSLLLDLFGLFALIGIGMAVRRRYLDKSFSKNRTVDDAISLTMITIILLTGFILEGLRIFVTSDLWAQWTPVGFAVSAIIQMTGLSVSVARSVHAVLWYCHMLLAFGFIAYIPYSKLFHMVASPLNILLKSSSRIGTLTPVRIILGETERIGAARLEDFTKKQLMELDACLTCLRCEKHCPAYEGGVHFSPRLLVQTLKKHAQYKYSFVGTKVKSFDSRLIERVISKEALLSCTSCGLCEEKCPVNVEHVNRIIDMRRSFMSEADNCPDEIQAVFENLSITGNPWGLASDTLGDLDVPLISEKKHTDVLYWPGCFGTYDKRNNKVTQVMLNLFKKAGVDFAVLGGEGNCCGDTARRLGNELLFQKLANANIKMLNGYNFRTIVTACPHCYNTLKNEYPELGGNYRVLHHTEYILELIESGKIVPSSMEKCRVTYHDPCYLGRYNSIYSAPRKILMSIPGVELVEMRNTKSKSCCCGAGGGRVWLDDQQKKKNSELRVKEAVKTNSDFIVSACPLCLVTLNDSVGTLESGIKNIDIAEIVNDLKSNCS